MLKIWQRVDVMKEQWVAGIETELDLYLPEYKKQTDNTPQWKIRKKHCKNG